MKPPIRILTLLPFHVSTFAHLFLSLWPNNLADFIIELNLLLFSYLLSAIPPYTELLKYHILSSVNFTKIHALLTRCFVYSFCEAPEDLMDSQGLYMIVAYITMFTLNPVSKFSINSSMHLSTKDIIFPACLMHIEGSIFLYFGFTSFSLLVNLIL